MRLSLYIGRQFLMAFLKVFGAFLAIVLLIDLIEQLRNGQAAQLTLAEAAVLALLNAPKSLHGILPLVLMLAAILFFLGFARTSELVVVRAAGRSGLQFLVPPVLVSLGLGLAVTLAFDPLVAATGRVYEQKLAERDARAGGASGGGTVLSVSEEGLWMRQGDAEGQVVIHAGAVGDSPTEFHRVSMVILAPDGQPQRRIEAASARLTPLQWQIQGAKVWDMTQTNPEAGARQQPQLELPTNLTPEQVLRGFGDPIAIGFWRMPGHIANLESAGLSALAHRVFYQMELAMPLLLVAMVLIAAGFTMRHARFGKTGGLVLLALACGFAIFFLRNFAQVLGENGQIPILVAAWTPPVAAILLALALLLHLEDG